MTKSISKAIKNAELKNKKIETFADLLESIDSLADKKKHLWKEIYDNAVTDRENASLLFTDIFTEMNGNAAQHAVLGSIASKYLERMCKSNEQILKLAELISKAEQESESIDIDVIYDSINKKK